MIGVSDTTHWISIAAGGAAGAVLRGLLARAAASPSPDRMPRFDPALATLAANLGACALLGAWTAEAELAGAAASSGFPGALSAFVAIGFCGSLSTFSTLCADAIRLARAEPRPRGAGRAFGYLLAHLAGGPLALAAGLSSAG
ncbi:MAG: CrcB family protein [Deltaproteobacteria bacterium]|nr:CrcB family protein [Deltaproteobacteria bacterium]